MNHPEADLQIQVADILRLHEAKRHFIFSSSPNELLGAARGKGGIARMARFKRMGLCPGWADITIVKDGRAYFLELKSKKGVISEAQNAFAERAFDAKADYAVVRSFDEALSTLRMWGIIQ